MLDRQSLQLEMEEKRQAHIRKMEIENARVRLALEGMEQCQEIALEAIKRDLEQGESFEKAMLKNDPSAVLATSYVFREALEGQYARERVGMYALAEALDTPDAQSSSEEPGATWTSRFMKYVSDLLIPKEAFAKSGIYDLEAAVLSLPLSKDNPILRSHTIYPVPCLLQQVGNYMDWLNSQKKTAGAEWNCFPTLSDKGSR